MQKRRSAVRGCTGFACAVNTLTAFRGRLSPAKHWHLKLSANDNSYALAAA